MAGQVQPQTSAMRPSLTLSLTLGILACGGAETAPRAEPITRGEPAVVEAAAEPSAEVAVCGPSGGEANGEPSECLGLPSDEGGPPGAQSVLGRALQSCSTDPVTGFRRTGACETGPEDRGVHVVCAEMTDAFLSYSKAQGNDLITPLPTHGFPGLQPGDKWCLCASRWREALEVEVAPPVDLSATHERALDFVTREQLEARTL